MYTKKRIVTLRKYGNLSSHEGGILFEVMAGCDKVVRILAEVASPYIHLLDGQSQTVNLPNQGDLQTFSNYVRF